MSDELNPCPFCGSEEYVTITNHPVYAGLPPSVSITCDECTAGGPDVTGKDEALAIAAWNTRPLEDALAADLATAQAEVERLKRWQKNEIEIVQSQARRIIELNDICTLMQISPDTLNLQGEQLRRQRANLAEAQARIQAYEKALQFYADRDTWEFQRDSDACTAIQDDWGHRARVALSPATPET